ncbi:tumor necrosis factor receptor superfamily member 25 [Rhinophrynus dorsalis]
MRERIPSAKPVNLELILNIRIIKENVKRVKIVMQPTQYKTHLQTSSMAILALDCHLKATEKFAIEILLGSENNDTVCGPCVPGFYEEDKECRPCPQSSQKQCSNSKDVVCSQLCKSESSSPLTSVLQKGSTLYDIIDSVPVKRWKEFIRILELQDKEIDIVEMEFTNSFRDQQYEMLRRWCQLRTAALESIYQALERMNLCGCAEELRIKIENYA